MLYIFSDFVSAKHSKSVEKKWSSTWKLSKFLVDHVAVVTRTPFPPELRKLSLTFLFTRPLGQETGGRPKDWESAADEPKPIY